LFEIKTTKDKPMPGANPDNEKPLSGKDEKRALRELGGAFSSQYPNPERKGCPGTQALKDFAYQRPMPNFTEVLDHIGHCSPCFTECQRYSRRFKFRHIALRYLLPIAVLAAALALFYLAFRHSF
jgi:hypothetical protein